jgi:hypothetical protein
MRACRLSIISRISCERGNLLLAKRKIISDEARFTGIPVKLLLKGVDSLYG